VPDGSASGDRRAQRAGGQLRGHPIAEGVADDAVPEQVLDRAAVELALDGRVLGDVGDPDQVRGCGAELALEQVVVHRDPGPGGLAAPPLPGGGRPQPLLRAQPPDPTLAHLLAGAFEFVGQEPVTELRVIAVRIDQCIDHVGV
jgi:hypothetical protein